MSSLVDALTQEGKLSAVVKDCLALLDAEVADKSGMSGFAIKAAFKAVKGIRPDFLENVVKDLVPEFAKALDPMFQEARGAGASFRDFLPKNANRAANDLLSITDGKAERSTNKVVKSAYGKLRGTAEKHVEAAMPRLGALIADHAE